MATPETTQAQPTLAQQALGFGRMMIGGVKKGYEAVSRAPATYLSIGALAIPAAAEAVDLVSPDPVNAQNTTGLVGRSASENIDMSVSVYRQKYGKEDVLSFTSHEKESCIRVNTIFSSNSGSPRGGWRVPVEAGDTRATIIPRIFEGSKAHFVFFNCNDHTGKHILKTLNFRSTNGYHYGPKAPHPQPKASDCVVPKVGRGGALKLTTRGIKNSHCLPGGSINKENTLLTSDQQKEAKRKVIGIAVARAIARKNGIKFNASKVVKKKYEMIGEAARFPKGTKLYPVIQLTARKVSRN